MLGMGIDRGEKIDGFENIWTNNDSSTSVSTYFSEYGLWYMAGRSLEPTLVTL